MSNTHSISHDVPAPMTPPDCDLRVMPFMPLEVARLRDSDMAATPNAEVFRAALMAYCACWHQVPAASLPDDDNILCRLLGYGRDIEAWRALRRDGALRGFIVCADGRLYHPVIAEKANHALTRLREGEASRKRHADQMRAFRSKKGTRAGNEAVQPPEREEDNSRDDHVLSTCVSSDDHDQTTCASRDLFEREMEKEKEKKKIQSPSDSAAPDAAPPVKPIRDLLWDDGIPILRDITGKSESASRALLGKLLKGVNDDCARVHNALREAHSLRPVDPVAWLVKACGGSPTGQREGRGDWAARELAAMRAGPREGRGDWAVRELAAMRGGAPAEDDASAAARFVRSTVIDHAAE